MLVIFSDLVFNGNEKTVRVNLHLLGRINNSA